MIPKPLRAVLLGSTGSIGTQTLNVVERLREAGRNIEVVGLAAGRNVDLLSEQARSFRPRALAIRNEEAAVRLRSVVPDMQVHVGPQGLVHLARMREANLVVNALVGAVGLRPTLAALECGCPVALANKESLVIGGELVRKALAAHGGRLFPLDSEHSGLLQCLEAGRREDIASVTLTASGGPLRNVPLDRFESVRPEDALAHPNWSMGSRITIDSATMVNKAFEVIEAHFLFDLPYERIEVVVHPESIVHAMVAYADGSTIAQLASHDMRIPIQYALTHPERPATDLPGLSFDESRSLHFEPLDAERYPAFATVLEGARLGGAALAALNAADEILVAQFLRGEIPFPAIATGLRQVLDLWKADWSDDVPPTLERVLEADGWAREAARERHDG